jgi:hypothetical protein
MPQGKPALIKAERKKKPAHFGRDDRKQKRPPPFATQGKQSAATTKAGALALLASRAEARPLHSDCGQRARRRGGSKGEKQVPRRARDDNGEGGAY